MMTYKFILHIKFYLDITSQTSSLKYANEITSTSEIEEISMINVQEVDKSIKISSPPWSEASSVILLDKRSMEICWHQFLKFNNHRHLLSIVEYSTSLQTLELSVVILIASLINRQLRLLKFASISTVPKSMFNVYILLSFTIAISIQLFKSLFQFLFSYSKF